MTHRNREAAVFAACLMLASCGGSGPPPVDGSPRSSLDQGAGGPSTGVARPLDSMDLAQIDPPKRTWTFDEDASGGPPSGWKTEQTNPRGRGAVWAILPDPTAPSGGQVLALTDHRGARGSTYNLAWTDEVLFQDGRIEVRLKPGTGRGDQGGGPMWRVQDMDNYYVARWNPLEDNFRLYYVEDGNRRQLESANAALSVDQWHTIAIEQRGDRITAFMDGKQMFETTDDTFTGPGGVGVWTKADAATSFDDLSVSGPGGR